VPLLRAVENIAAAIGLVAFAVIAVAIASQAILSSTSSLAPKGANLDMTVAFYADSYGSGGNVSGRLDIYVVCSGQCSGSYIWYIGVYGIDRNTLSSNLIYLNYFQKYLSQGATRVSIPMVVSGGYNELSVMVSVSVPGGTVTLQRSVELR